MHDTADHPSKHCTHIQALHTQTNTIRYLIFAPLDGQTRLQRFKIGLVWPDEKDKYMNEQNLDLNEGTPDRRGQNKIQKVLWLGRGPRSDGPRSSFKFLNLRRDSQEKKIFFQALINISFVLY